MLQDANSNLAFLGSKKVQVSRLLGAWAASRRLKIVRQPIVESGTLRHNFGP